MPRAGARRWLSLLALAALLLVAVPTAARAEGDAGPPPGVSIWRLALYKALTFETAANTADLALFALFFGGGPAAAAGFFAANIATAGVAYYTHEVAWDYFSPAVDAESAARIAVQKTISYRVVSTMRNFALGNVFGGGLGATVGFTVAGQILDAALYYANETLWTAYGPPIAR